MAAFHLEETWGNMEDLTENDLGITCLACGDSMEVTAIGELEFMAACHACDTCVSLSFSESGAYTLVEMGRTWLVNKLNEDIAVMKGKVVRLNDKR